MSNIDISNLKLSYKSNNAIKKKDLVLNIEKLNVKKGSIIGFFGPNHVGKTTLLKFIVQIHKNFIINTECEIKYDNNDFDRENNKPLLLYVPQDFSSSLLPWYTVIDNITIILKALKYNDDDIKKKIDEFSTDFGYNDIDELLLDFGIYTNKNSSLQKRKISELSGGQKQIITVLRTLISYPDIIAMDEPFSALDTFRKGNSFRSNVFNFLRNKNITTFVISHELEEIFSFADGIYIFNYDNNGKILKGYESNYKGVNFNTFLKEMNNKYNL